MVEPFPPRKIWSFDLHECFLNALQSMKAKFSLIALCFALALTSSNAFAADSGNGSDEQQLKKIEQDWADAYVKRDPAIAQRITADDFVFVGPAGNIVNRNDYVKEMTGDTVFTAFKFDELKVRIYGDAAVVVGVANISAKAKGEEESGQYSFTDVFMKQKGEWKAVSGHVTPVAKDQATE
jgi:ketosteroid isomerase-like protein